MSLSSYSIAAIVLGSIGALLIIIALVLLFRKDGSKSAIDDSKNVKKMESASYIAKNQQKSNQAYNSYLESFGK